MIFGKKDETGTGTFVKVCCSKFKSNGFHKKRSFRDLWGHNLGHLGPSVLPCSEFETRIYLVANGFQSP